MKLTYFDTLYHRQATMMVAGEIRFKKDGIEFASMGHTCFIEYEYVIRIEEAEN